MNNQKKILSFKLPASFIDQIRAQQQLVIDRTKTGLDIVIGDSCLNINYSKESKAEVPTAVYYNNNGGNLHFLGEAIPATTAITKIEKKKPVVTDIKKSPLNIPRSDVPSPKPLKKPITTTSKQKAASSHIPTLSTSRPPVIPKTLKAASTNNTTKKSNASPSSPSETNYEMECRIIQRLALHPWSANEMIKSIDRTQQEKCDQLEVKHILENVAVLFKKGERNRFCLKPVNYKNIKIWDWPFYSMKDKITVAENTKEAYDLMNTNETEIDRPNLYHPEHYPYKAPTKRSPNNINRKGTPQSVQRKPTPTAATPTTPLIKTKRPQSPNEAARRQKSSSNRGQATSPFPATIPKVSTPTKVTKTFTPPPIASKKSPIWSLPKKSPAEPANKKSPTEPLKRVEVPAKRSPLPEAKKSTSETHTLQVKKSSDSTRLSEAKSENRVLKKSPVLGPTKKNDTLNLPQKTSKASSSKVPSTKASKSLTPSVKRKMDEEETSRKKISASQPLVDIKSQRQFTSYCKKFLFEQKSFVHDKRYLKDHHTEYLQTLKNTPVPHGQKRSYDGTNLEFRDLVRSNYKKQHAYKKDILEAESKLHGLNKKRRRVMYMYQSIKHNIESHKYQIPTTKKTT